MNRPPLAARSLRPLRLATMTDLLKGESHDFQLSLMLLMHPSRQN